MIVFANKTIVTPYLYNKPMLRNFAPQEKQYTPIMRFNQQNSNIIDT